MYTLVPAPEQTTKTKNDLKKVELQDTIIYKPFNGGENVLLKIERIGTHKTDANAPRVFFGQKKGKQVYAYENQVLRVIFKSREEYEDLQIQPNVNVESVFSH